MCLVSPLPYCLSNSKGLLAQTLPLEFQVHSHLPGDYIFVKTWNGVKLEPAWEGPYQLLLTTEMAVHTVKRGRTHYTQVKRAPPGEQWTVSSEPGDTKVTLKDYTGTIFHFSLGKLCIYH
jgi:hypothetical protein